MSQSTNRSVPNVNSRPLWAVFREEVSHALSYSVKSVQGRDRAAARADKAGRRFTSLSLHLETKTDSAARHSERVPAQRQVTCVTAG